LIFFIIIEVKKKMEPVENGGLVPWYLDVLQYVEPEHTLSDDEPEWREHSVFDDDELYVEPVRTQDNKDVFKTNFCSSICL